MKTKFFFPVLCALMVCLVACGDEPSGGDDKDAFDENGVVANGVFTIGEGKQVLFSRGNLQYQASTNTWRFAEHQYDYVGKDNENISATYEGWIDLFGWGTGNNPTKASENDDDYGTFVDWGKNYISNGGGYANKWRTLSQEEWNYLFEKRANAKKLYGAATIKTASSDCHGLVILPDGWNNSKIAFHEGMNGWNNNEYSLDEWNKLEKSGAVFLPASGFRHGKTRVHDVGINAVYWSSSTASPGVAYIVDIYEDVIDFEHDYGYSHGFSVRLVHDL